LGEQGHVIGRFNEKKAAFQKKHLQNLLSRAEIWVLTVVAILFWTAKERATNEQ
jgi:hypothetical protein